MTPDELQRLKDLCERATAGPWLASAGFSVIQTNHVTRDVWTIPMTHDDIAFIAASREALPNLLAFVEHLELYIADLEHTVDVNGEFIKRVAEKKWRNGDLVIEAQKCLKGEK